MIRPGQRSTRGQPGPDDAEEPRSGRQIRPAGVCLLVLVLLSLAKGPSIDPRWAAVVGSVGAACLLVGLGWGLVVPGRVRLAASSPADLTVGDDAVLTLDAGGPLSGVRVRALDPGGPWIEPVAGANDLLHRADQRGVFGAVRLEVRGGDGLGVLSNRRVVLLPLAHEVVVAPRPNPASWTPTALPEQAPSTLSSPGASTVGDVVRAVRPYQPGDPARLVHWPTTQRAGTLVVRELEPPVHSGVAVSLHLRAPGDAAETAASDAFGLVLAVLATGGEARLLTCEPSGPVSGVVTTRLEAGRRLARAVPGTPPPAPAGWPVEQFVG